MDTPIGTGGKIDSEVTKTQIWPGQPAVEEEELSKTKHYGEDYSSITEETS